MKKNKMVQQQFRWPPNGTNKKQKEHDQKKKKPHTDTNKEQKNLKGWGGYTQRIKK